jgi:hypothetical protein
LSVILRVGAAPKFRPCAASARQAHNLEGAGSNPVSRKQTNGYFEVRPQERILIPPFGGSSQVSDHR